MTRRHILLGIVIIGLTAIAWLGRSHLSLDALAEQERQLRATIESYPFTSWLTAFVIYLLASLVPGTRGKAIVCGWLFGFLAGIVLVNFALTGAAVVAFLASRYFIGDTIENRYPAQLLWANTALERDGAWYVVLLRVVPVSFTLTNYLLGATRLRLRTYWWATQIGILPGNLAFVYLGAGLPSLKRIAEQGVLALFSWELLIGFAMLSLLPLAVYRALQWLHGQFWPARMPQSPSM